MGSHLLVVEHDGYRKLGIAVRRSVLRVGDDIWLVVDDLLGQGEHHVQMAWTLPDLDYELADETLSMESSEGPLKLYIEGGSISLLRAGVNFSEESPQGDSPLLGWFSPTYGSKEPALCALVSADVKLPNRIVARWFFGDAVEGDWHVELTDAGSSKLPFRTLVYHKDILKNP
jgi:hypothetical protein